MIYERLQSTTDDLANTTMEHLDALASEGILLALTGLPIGYSVIVALTIGYSVIVALTGLPIGYSVIVALTGLPIGYSVIVFNRLSEGTWHNVTSIYNHRI